MSEYRSKIRHYGLTSQAAGLLVLLLPMFLNNFYSYIVAYRISIMACFLSTFIFIGLSKGRVYQFMLLPATLVLVLYSIFLLIKLDPVLFVYSPLIIEWLFVAVLAINGMMKKQVLIWVRSSRSAGLKRKHIQSSLIEYYYIAQVSQNLYTLHLFILIFYMILPEEYKNLSMERFIYTDAPLLIGLVIIIFEQIRLFFFKRNLKTEKWLPIMDKKGKVIGRVPFSVSLSSQSKHCHPVVRVAVIYNGMFYLIKRGPNEPVSPLAPDYPFYGYVVFKQSIEDAMKKLVGPAISKSDIKPRLLIRYPFENDKVNSFVSLYIMSVRTEEQYTAYIKREEGKLWTRKQIEENLGKGVFSEYFEKEFPYIKNTILLAEEFCGRKQNAKQATDSVNGSRAQ